MLEEMNKKGDFTYFGHKDELYNGDCGITTASSGSLAHIKHYAKFNFGVGIMPYDESVPNAIIVGTSLWVIKGKNADT